MRYFKTSIPNTKVWLSNGASIKWDKIDEQNGVLAVDDPNIARELDSAIAGERGGVQVSSEAEYAELKKKQLEHPSPGVWREEYGPGVLFKAQRGRSPIVPAAVVADTPKETKMETVTVPLPHQEPVKIARPKSVKR